MMIMMKRINKHIKVLIYDMMKPLQPVNQIKIGKMERLELPKVPQIPSQDVGISFPSCACDVFSLQAFGAFPNTGISHSFSESYEDSVSGSTCPRHRCSLAGPTRPP